MDLIDKRNKEEKMKKSVIKGYNVVYTSPQKIQENRGNHEDQESSESGGVHQDQSGEIMRRLEQDKHQNQADILKERELKRLLEEQELVNENIDRILEEKHSIHQETIRQAGEK